MEQPLKTLIQDGRQAFTAVMFKAGLMRLQDGKLVADTRKGVIKVAQDDDSVVHFLWFERQGPTVESANAMPEVDHMIFPEEASFTKLNVGDNRIYTLSFQNDKERTMHFWMQEPKANDDEDLASAVQHALDGLAFLEEDMEEDSLQEDAAASGLVNLANDRPAPGVAGAPRQGIIKAEDLAAALRAIMPSPQGGPQSQVVTAAQLASMLAGVGGGPSATPGGPVPPPPTQQQLQQQLLQQQRLMKAPGPTLAEVLKPEVMQPLLQAPDMLERLGEHLPQQHRNPAALAELAASAQLRHQMDVFSNALMTAQLDLSHFGLRSRGFTIVDFLEAIQEKADAEAGERATGQAPK